MSEKLAEAICSDLQRILAPGFRPLPPPDEDTELFRRNFLGGVEPKPSPPMEPTAGFKPEAAAAVAAAWAAAAAITASDLTACDKAAAWAEPAAPADKDMAACAAAAAAKLSLFCRRFTNNELVKLLSLCSNLTLEDIAVAAEDELLEAADALETDADAGDVLASALDAAWALSDFIEFDDFRCLSSSSVIIVIDMI